jgi:putative two-component system response regulator
MKQRVIAVDDQPDNLLIIEDFLGKTYDIITFGRGQAMVDYFEAGNRADLVLLDIVMPMPDGYALCNWLKGSPMTRDIPVVFLTGLENSEEEAYALSIGAEDFIHKPLSPPVLSARVRNHLALAQARRALQDQNRGLEKLVVERTRKIQEQSDELMRRTEQLISAQSAIISAFCSLVEARDNETGNHVLRTQHYVLTLCEKLSSHPRFSAELTQTNIPLIFKSAPLHDIGKVAIPDHILLKPGKLTPEEWRIMQQHAQFGADAIAAAEKEIGEGNASFLSYARQIALTHHERWNGKGYPRGLVGDEIPLAGRLMAIADVYDALISRRIYKPPFEHAAAVEMMRNERGEHFDPDILDCMLANSAQFKDIARCFADPV